MLEVAGQPKLVLRQQGRLLGRVRAMQHLQRAGVKRLDNYPVLHSFGHDHGHQQPYKFLGRGLQMAVAGGREFGFDVVTRRGPMLAPRVGFDRVDYLGQQRLIGSQLLLPRKLGVARPARVAAPNVGVGHGVEPVAPLLTFRHGLARGRAHKIGVQERVVGKQWLLVLADGDVHFQGGHAQVQGPAHGRNSVFRHQAPAAAVALRVEPFPHKHGALDSGLRALSSPDKRREMVRRILRLVSQILWKAIRTGRHAEPSQASCQR